MPNERTQTDQFVRRQIESLGVEYDEQGSSIVEVQAALRTASKHGTKKQGKPEFVFMSGDFLVIVEDKLDIRKALRLTDEGVLDRSVEATKDYALNGAIHYAEHISVETEFKRVFAIGIAGHERSHDIRVAFVENGSTRLLDDALDTLSLLGPTRITAYHRQAVLGEPSAEELDLEKITSLAKVLHEDLRNYGQLSEKEKPLVLSAILLALEFPSFSAERLTGSEELKDGRILLDSVAAYMKGARLPEEKREAILSAFSFIAENETLNTKSDSLKKTPLRYFVEFTDREIKHAIKMNIREDILGRFYGQFIRYTGGDGNGLGIVLTPSHVTELMCDLVGLDKHDIVFDPCTGSASFLVSAMHKMIEDCTTDAEVKAVKSNQIHGIELRPELFAVAATNMILRGDGKSHVRKGDFILTPPEELAAIGATVGLINPPYSQDKKNVTAHLSELAFVERLLDALARGGRCAAIVPRSVMVGATNEDKKRKTSMLAHHTLEAVVTLSGDSFYGVGVEPVIAVFTAHQPHPADKVVRFLNFEDDGYEVRKHIGLVATETATDKRQRLLDAFNGTSEPPASLMVSAQTSPSEEWLHATYFVNDQPISKASLMASVEEFALFCAEMRIKRYDRHFPSALRGALSRESLPDLNTLNFAPYVVSDVFTVATTLAFHLSEYRLVPGWIAEAIPYVSRTTQRNGLEGFIDGSGIASDRRQAGNCIVAGAESARFFYQGDPFVNGNKIYTLRSDSLSRGSGLFVAAALNFAIQGSAFGYGLGLVKSRIERLSVLLPVASDGEPDWARMDSLGESMLGLSYGRLLP